MRVFAAPPSALTAAEGWILIEAPEGLTELAVPVKAGFATAEVDGQLYSLVQLKTSTSFFLGAVEGNHCVVVGNLRSFFTLQPSAPLIENLWRNTLSDAIFGTQQKLMFSELSQTLENWSLSAQATKQGTKILLQDLPGIWIDEKWQPTNISALASLGIETMKIVRAAAMNPTAIPIGILCQNLKLSVKAGVQLMMLCCCNSIEGNDDYVTLNPGMLLARIVQSKLSSNLPNGVATKSEVTKLVNEAAEELESVLPLSIINETPEFLPYKSGFFGGDSCVNYLELEEIRSQWWDDGRCLNGLLLPLGQDTFRFLPHLQFPCNSFERLTELFRLRKSWPESELEAYSAILPSRYDSTAPSFHKIKMNFLVSVTTRDGKTIWRDSRILAND